MKKQFQSKSVPRGTRTIWRYLGALLLMFTFAIGNVMAADVATTFDFANGSTDGLTIKKSGTVANISYLVTNSTYNQIPTLSDGNYFLGMNFTSNSQGVLDVITTNSFTNIKSISFDCAADNNSNPKIAVYIIDDKDAETAVQNAMVMSSGSTKVWRSKKSGVGVYTIDLSSSPKTGKVHFKFTTGSSGKSGAIDNIVITTESAAPGGDPVDPTFTYTPATYTIGDPALDLSTKLTSTNTTGAITFAIKDAAGTGATIANSKNFTATTVGTAKVTVTQAASTGYNAKSQDIDVTVAAPDPCTTYFHFVATADATANGKTNWDGFTNAPTGSNGQSNSVTIDGSSYTLTKRTGSTGEGGTILGFTIPANKAGTLYGYMKSSGTGARTLSLKKGDDVVKTNTEITDGNWTLITISAIAPGTYTLSPNKNVQIQMFALKVCDAEFHTVTFDADGGSTVASISALDGAPATKPADPTKENADFVKWVVKSTGNDYDWKSNVTGDLTLKAVWSQWPKLTLEAGEGATGDAVVTYRKVGSSVTVPAKPEGFSNGTSSFTGWVYSSDVEITDGAFPMPSSDLTLTAQWASATAVAQIVGGDSYETFAAAIAAVTDGQTIQLIQDITQEEAILIDKNLTLDLNNKTFTVTNPSSEYSNRAIKVTAGTIVIENGTVDALSNETHNSGCWGSLRQEGGHLTCNNVTFKNYRSGGLGLKPVGGTLILNECTVLSEIGGGLELGNATVEVNNCTFTQTGTDAQKIYGACFGMGKMGTLTINGGTYTSDNYSFYIYTSGGTINVNSGTFAGDIKTEMNNTQYPSAVGTINISGGTFDGVGENPIVFTAVTANDHISISGGVFDAPIENQYCAEGYVPQDNGDGTYGVKPLAQTFSLEDLVTAQGTGANYTTYLNNLGWTVANEDALDNLNTDKDYDNYPYLGLKFKNAAGYVAGEVEGGKLLTIKLGHMAGVAHLMVDDVKKMELDGVDAETPKVHYYYVENTANVKLLMANAGSKQTCVLKAITVADPFTVTFDANGGEAVASLNGTPSVTLPSATKGTDSFLGWFDGETKVGEAGDTYTPTANITLVAHWEAVSTDARLASISFSSDAGTLSPAFDPEVTSYTYTMPYGTASVPTITGATSVSAKAKAPVIDAQAANWGDVAHIHGVAQSDDTKDYYVQMLRAPKDGVSLVKIEPTSQTKGTQTGLYPNGDELTINLSSGMNLGGSGKYIGVKATENFQEGDVLHLDLTAKPNTSGSTQIILYAEKEATNEVWATGELASEAKDYYLTLPAAVNGHNELYIVRTEGNKWNGGPSVMEVTRAMNPMLTTMTIDGRTVTINEAAKTATVTIPYEADLAALTITKTIVWNAPATENSIVVNDGSAWVESPSTNTYKLTDKDGDYTVYTITLTRDVVKHAVKFYDGETLLETVEVEDGTNIAAGDVPADPEKEDYLFQGWAETADGAAVDVTSFTISAAKNFYAKWVSDGAIKLIVDGTSGKELNTTDYITGVTIQTDATGGVKLAGTVSDVNSVKDLTRVIAYNAKSSKTKIQIKAYNTNSSDRTFVVKGLVEGADAAVQLASITLGNKETKTTDWIEFNNDDAKNRTIYIFSSSSASDIRFLQVKVIDDGATATKKAGEVGYSLNFNQGRFFGLKETTAQFEGMSVDIASSDCQPLSSSVVKVKEASMSFTAAAPVLLKVTTANNKTYYVANSTTGTTNETTKTGESEFNLAAGTWFINAGASEVQFTNIAFELPKAAKPVVADMDNVEYCQGSAIDELEVSATVSDGGTMLYQWYHDGVAIDGAEAAKYQPTADGEYYVVVVNTKADHQNSDPTQSNTITVTGYAATVLSGTTGAENWPDADVTISVTASGKNLHYAWYTCYDAMGTNPVAVTPAVDAAELDVTVGAADTYYKVVVSGDCGDAQEAIITVVARQAVELQDVTGNMSWDFSKANDGSAATSNLCTDEVMANVHGINNNDDFKSAYLKATANKFSSSKLQASMIKFHTTVDGMITVVFSNTDNKSSERYLTVNGRKTDKGSKTKTAVTYTGFVYAGDVELGVVEGDGNMLNFISVAFKATVDYPRTVNPSYLGTLCWTNNAILGGATLYEFAGKNEYNYLVFDEVAENRLEAGKPYIFMPENGNTEIKVYNTDNEPAKTESDLQPVNHMYGTVEGKTLVPGVDDNMYYFSASHIWAVKDFVVDINVPAYYCYVDYEAVLNDEPAPAPAPGRRRVTMGVQGQQVATGIEDVQGDKVQCTKMLINGQLFILRGEKMYDAKGQLVK